MEENFQNNTNSVVGFVLGIISFFLNFWGIVGILAIVFSSIGLSQTTNDKTFKNINFSLFGIIFGIINIFYAIFQIC